MPQINSYPNLRMFTRVELRERAVLFFGKDSEVSETVQVGEEGMMTFTTLRLQEGDQITVHFSVAGKYIRARADVVYMLPAVKDERSKIGLRFKSLFEEYRIAIREFVN